jgi:hypothetical protein
LLQNAPKLAKCVCNFKHFPGLYIRPSSNKEWGKKGRRRRIGFGKKEGEERSKRRESKGWKRSG